MDFGRPFTFIFDDQQWTEKLVLAAIIGLLSVIPLVGLIFTAALLGYAVQLVQNMQAGKRHPLPDWSNIGDKMLNGANVMVASIVYVLPLVFISCLFLVVPLALSSDADFMAGGTALVLTCCLIPVLLIYSLVIMPMLALGGYRYAETQSISVFFQFGDLLAALQANSSTVLMYILMSIGISLIIGLLAAIPCIGWLAAIALTYPVQAHLIGQFGALVDEKPKRDGKPKRGFA